LIKAALAAGSLFGGTATQAEKTAAPSLETQAIAPAEQSGPTAVQSLPASISAGEGLELTKPPSDLTLPTLEEVVALADTDAQGLVSDKDLAGQRGGANIVVADQDLSQVTANNILNGNYVAGNISVTDNAFSNFTGIGNVLINTGGMSSIQ